MPLFEFRCIECRNIFEILVMNSEESIALQCPQCGSENIERVLSASHYSVGSGSGALSKPRSETRTCASGSCTSYDIPGPA